MELMQAIRARRSIRNYLDSPVEEEKLLAVLEAGRLAPSARNMQDWRFIVVSDPATRQRLAEAARDQQFVAQAPLVIAACGTSDLVMTCGQPAYAIDVAIALSHDPGRSFPGPGKLLDRSLLRGQGQADTGSAAGGQVVALLPLGYPADMPAPRPRKSLEDIAAREHW